MIDGNRVEVIEDPELWARVVKDQEWRQRREERKRASNRFWLGVTGTLFGTALLMLIGSVLIGSQSRRPF